MSSHDTTSRNRIKYFKRFIGMDCSDRFAYFYARRMARLFKYPESTINFLKFGFDEDGKPKAFDQNKKKVMEEEYNRLLNRDRRDGGFRDINAWYYGGHTRNRNGKRTLLQYSQDLIFTWLCEDIVAYFILNNGIDIRFNGADNNRDVMLGNKNREECKPYPDFEVSVNGKKRFLELQCSWSGFEFENRVIEIRRGKLPYLRETKAILVQYEPHTGRYAIIDMFRDELEAKILYHGMYHNIVYDIVEGDKGFEIKKDINNLIDDIKRCCDVDTNGERAKIHVECGNREDYERAQKKLDLKSLLAVHKWCIETQDGSSENYKRYEDVRCDCGLSVRDCDNPSTIKKPAISWPYLFESESSDLFDVDANLKEAIKRAFTIDTDKPRGAEPESVVNQKETTGGSPVEFDCSEWA